MAYNNMMIAIDDHNVHNRIAEAGQMGYQLITADSGWIFFSRFEPDPHPPTPRCTSWCVEHETCVHLRGHEGAHGYVPEDDRPWLPVSKKD